MIQAKLLLHDRNCMHVCVPIYLSTHSTPGVLGSSVAGICTTHPLTGAEKVLSQVFWEDHYSGCFVFPSSQKPLDWKIRCLVWKELLYPVRHQWLSVDCGGFVLPCQMVRRDTVCWGMFQSCACWSPRMQLTHVFFILFFVNYTASVGSWWPNSSSMC